MRVRILEMKNRMLAAALEYAALGWRVFPIYSVNHNGVCECGTEKCEEAKKAGKHPALNAWNKDASRTPSTIEAWWNDKPDRGIGIATGMESGITVLDVDGEEGVEELGKLLPNGVPPTPCAQSRPGHYHYYFQFTDAVKSQAKKLDLHLDTRNNNGYVVAPPSRHATGGLYAWLQHPSKVSLAPWPTFEGKAGKKETRGRPQKEMFNPANPTDEARLKSALETLDPDDEMLWSQVGWILGRAYRQSDAGYAVYSAWSGKSRKFNAKRSRGHYYERSKEKREDGGPVLTVSSIFKWATEAGWIAEIPGEQEERGIHVFENPYKEQTMVEEMAAAAAACPQVFLMGLRLVHIVMYGTSGVEDVGVERDPMTYVVLDHNTDTLAVQMGNVAAYWSMGANGFKRSSFKRASITTFLNCHITDGIKPLLAFVPHPTIRADGTMITEVGYDPASRLYLTATVEGMGKVETKLTRKGAEDALRRVLAPFSEYPWATPRDRTVFVAALLTVGLRHLFDIVPLFAFSSPKHGSGKTQLAECISRLWYGTTLSKATWTGNPEEMEKRIAAFLLAGDRMVCLDNVTEGQRLEDSTLNKVLTSRRNTFRLLGKTERLELTNEATWFATGNQLQLSGDISRRALLCYLDAKVIDPGSRTFKIENLPEYITKNRAAIMTLLLSIVASWIAAGRPEVKASPRGYGSFTLWYALLRPLLLWTGEGDLADAIDNAQEEDTENDALGMFANELRRALPPDGTRVPLMGVMKLFTANDGLRSAFTGCVAAGREVNPRSLSELMRRVENKIFVTEENAIFAVTKRVDSASKRPEWRVENRDS